jgi:hypothetical protein
MMESFASGLKQQQQQDVPTSRSAVSPADSVTQAMKRDLEDLIAHIDGFVLDSKTSSPRPSQQFLFHDEKTPGTMEPSNDSHRKPIHSQAIFRDRTNAEASSPCLPVKPPRPDPVETARASPPTDAASPLLEPAGSPPVGESSLYFHDESLSMILSQSSYDVEDGNLPGDGQDKYSSTFQASPSPRLMTRLREGGILPSSGPPEATPARPRNDQTKTKSISFRKVSRDATPAKFLDNSNTEVFSPSALSFPNLASFSKDMTKDTTAQDDDGNETSWLNTNAAEVTAGSKSWSLIRDATPHSSHRQCDGVTDEDEGSVVRNLNEVTNPTETDMTLDNNGTPKTLSPENAKKLLQIAIDTLKDARYERESSRKWAQEIKESVEQWVEEQRELIRTESASVAATSAAALSTASSAQVQKLESSINKLQSEIWRSNTIRSDQDNKLEELLLRQEARIASLTGELSAVKTQLMQILTKDDGLFRRETRRISTPNVRSTNPPRYPSTPKSLSSNRWSEASVASSHTNRSRTRTPNGGHLVKYGNGITKEIHPDGTTVTRFVNGDVETRFGDTSTPKNGGGNKGIVAYFHSEEGVLQITQEDGSMLYEYANGQIERHYTDGSKVVLFSDGTKRIVKGGGNRDVD